MREWNINYVYYVINYPFTMDNSCVSSLQHFFFFHIQHSMFIVQVASAFRICIDWASISEEEEEGTSNNSNGSGPSSHYKDGIADNEIGQLFLHIELTYCVLYFVSIDGQVDK